MLLQTISIARLKIFKILSGITGKNPPLFVATICARAISGSVGYILNLYISFQSKLNPGREMVRYSIVFVCQMAAGGILVSLLSVIPIPTIIVKAIIDTILFFVVYNIQKNWVFADTFQLR